MFYILSLGYNLNYRRLPRTKVVRAFFAGSVDLQPHFLSILAWNQYYASLKNFSITLTYSKRTEMTVFIRQLHHCFTHKIKDVTE